MFCCGYDYRNEMTREEILREIARIEEEKRVLSEIFAKYPEIREVRMQERGYNSFMEDSFEYLDLLVINPPYLSDVVLNSLEEEIEARLDVVPTVQTSNGLKYSDKAIQNMELMYGAE